MNPVNQAAVSNYSNYKILILKDQQIRESIQHQWKEEQEESVKIQISQTMSGVQLNLTRRKHEHSKSIQQQTEGKVWKQAQTKIPPPKQNAS